MCFFTVPSRTWLQFVLPVRVGDDGNMDIYKPHGISDGFITSHASPLMPGTSQSQKMVK